MGGAKLQKKYTKTEKVAPLFTYAILDIMPVGIHDVSTLSSHLRFSFNPFPPSVPIWHRLAKHSILILEGITKKISYERRDYESVDEKSLSRAMSRKTTNERIQNSIQPSI